MIVTTFPFDVLVKVCTIGLEVRVGVGLDVVSSSSLLVPGRVDVVRVVSGDEVEREGEGVLLVDGMTGGLLEGGVVLGVGWRELEGDDCWDCDRDDVELAGVEPADVEDGVGVDELSGGGEGLWTVELSV